MSGGKDKTLSTDLLEAANTQCLCVGETAKTAHNTCKSVSFEEPHKRADSSHMSPLMFLKSF